MAAVEQSKLMGAFTILSSLASQVAKHGDMLSCPTSINPSFLLNLFIRADNAINLKL